MKVFILTTHKPFEPAQYVCASTIFTGAETYLKATFKNVSRCGQGKGKLAHAEYVASNNGIDTLFAIDEIEVANATGKVFIVLANNKRGINIFTGLSNSMKSAEKELRLKHPYMRPVPNCSSETSKTYFADSTLESTLVVEELTLNIYDK